LVRHWTPTAWLSPPLVPHYLTRSATGPSSSQLRHPGPQLGSPLDPHCLTRSATGPSSSQLRHPGPQLGSPLDPHCLAESATGSSSSQLRQPGPRLGPLPADRMPWTMAGVRGPPQRTAGESRQRHGRRQAAWRAFRHSHGGQKTSNCEAAGDAD